MINSKKQKAFTLIELLVVLAILAILVAVISPLYLNRLQDAREVVLKQNLYEIRKIIDQFYRDRSRYPKTMEELVELKYIRELPFDPIQQKNNAWIIVKPDQSEGVIDIRSASKELSSDGKPYTSW